LISQSRGLGDVYKRQNGSRGIELLLQWQRFVGKKKIEK
jgi:hypothetical protein